MSLNSLSSRRKPSPNLLFLIVLSIIACTSVNSAVSLPGELEHGLNTLNLPLKSVSYVRTPKHDATKDSISWLAARVATSLRFHRELIIPWSRLIFSRMTPKRAFIYLKLDKEADKLLESPAFPVWVHFVRRKYPKSADNRIIETLVSHHKDQGYFLAKLLVKGLKTPGQKEMASQILYDLCAYWKHNKFTTDQVFALLKLNKYSDEQIIYDDLLHAWMDYVTRHDEDISSKMAEFPFIKDIKSGDERQKALNELYHKAMRSDHASQYGLTIYLSLQHASSLSSIERLAVGMCDFTAWSS